MASSSGIDRNTGRRLTDWDHVRQSIADIVTTPQLTEVLLRQYGSRLRDLVDAPMNDASIVLFYGAVAEALDRWEPRFELTDVSIGSAGPDGHIEMSLTGVYMPLGHHGDRTPAGPMTLFVALSNRAETLSGIV
jgi:uncharacterized protein